MFADRTYHRYAPTFDFAGKGFGPILHDERDVRRWIVDSVDAGGRCEEPYRGRADRFFGFRDSENCERVWREISSVFVPSSDGVEARLSGVPHAGRSSAAS